MLYMQKNGIKLFFKQLQ